MAKKIAEAVVDEILEKVEPQKAVPVVVLDVTAV